MTEAAKNQDKTNPPSYKSGIKMMGSSDQWHTHNQPLIFLDSVCFTYRFLTCEVSLLTFPVQLWEKNAFLVLLKEENRL